MLIEWATYLIQDNISLLLVARTSCEVHRKRLHCIHDAIRRALPTSESHTVLLNLVHEPDSVKQQPMKMERCSRIKLT